ncbi:MAG: PAS domain S-box protein [Spirochaetes bacterium]|nr:PAS domain S-box protein [Spirochaetota bacterium]
MNIFLVSDNNYPVPEKIIEKYGIVLFDSAGMSAPDYQSDIFILAGGRDFKNISSVPENKVIILCPEMPAVKKDNSFYIRYEDTGHYLPQILDMLLMQDDKYSVLFSNMLYAYALHEIIFDENNNPADFVLIDVNPAFRKLTGIKGKVRGKSITALPGMEESWSDIYYRVVLDQKNQVFENFSLKKKEWYSIHVYPAGKNRFAVFFENITIRKQMEISLQKTEEKYRNYIEQIPIAVFITDCSAKILYSNDAAAEMTGYTEKELQHLKISELVTDHEPDAENIFELCSPKKELKLNRKDGSGIDIVYESVRIEDDSILIFCIDITAEKKSQNDILKKEKLLSSLFDNTYSLIVILSLEGRIIFLNKKALEVSGMDLNESLNRFLWDTSPWNDSEDEKARLLCHFTSCAEGKVVHFKTGYLKCGNDNFYFDVTLNPVKNSSGEIEFIFAEQHDVSEIYKYESELRESLSQKDILLKEIHHRVKNNMQIILSLLNMQSRLLKNESDRLIFLESQNRIKVMALVHEKIYQSKNLSEIDYSQYVHQLIDYYDGNFSISDKIGHTVEIGDIKLNVDEAIPLSLIINEIVTNSFKYAFNDIPEERYGESEIIIKMTADNNSYYLTISDNGSGMENSDMFYNGNTLGFKLIRGLIHQLKGTVELNTDNGFHYDIVIPVPESIE